MSIVFKPKIKFNFSSGMLTRPTKVVAREKWHWTNKDLNRLTELKALGLSYVEISKLLGRSANSCGTAMHTNKLKSTYKLRRQKLIEEIMND
jgi:hypothetical protein